MTLRLNLRQGNETVRAEIPAGETALLLCDMWDDHWCRSAARRCDALARKMDPIVAAARARGVQIIHAPSDCMAFYAEAPQRRRMQDIPRVEPPRTEPRPEPPLPIDDSDGGCDDTPPCPQRHPWTRQHPAIHIAAEDVISDDGAEVYSLLRQKGIGNLLIAGVHTNMCVLRRSFAIRQMTAWGVRCILVRDLTDSMYNPRRSPFVNHDEGTELVIQYIERHYGPSVLSRDLAAAGQGVTE
jgi:nicotinamidase-related amidase